MQLDHERFGRDGFLILRGFLEPDELHELRLGFDVLVQLSQEQSRRERTPDQPIGGAWQAAAQPRVMVDDLVTAETAHVAGWFIGKPLGVSTELLGAKRAGIGSLELMVSAVWDFGATDWHRDYCSNYLAPLAGVQRDLAINGPPYVQWNVALYDDDLFWVIPGSHANPDSEQLKEQLLRDCRGEMPGAFQADLKAGDAIVYAAYMQHQGSPYTSRMRRVIHMGYYDFDKISSFGHHPHWNMDLEFTRHLAPAAREWFEQQAAWTMQCRDQYERIFRTALERDGAAFVRELAAAHPEVSCRMVAVAHLCRMAEKVAGLCGTGAAELSEAERSGFEGGFGEHFWSDMRGRFTPAEADELGKRFAPLTAQMAADRECSNVHYTEVHRNLMGGPGAASPPDFYTRPLRTHYHQMPDLTLDELIATW